MRPQMWGMSGNGGGGGGGRMALFGPVERTAAVMSNMVVQKLMRQVRARALGATTSGGAARLGCTLQTARCDGSPVTSLFQLRCEWLSPQCCGVLSSRTCCSK